MMGAESIMKRQSVLLLMLFWCSSVNVMQGSQDRYLQYSFVEVLLDTLPKTRFEIGVDSSGSVSVLSLRTGNQYVQLSPRQLSNIPPVKKKIPMIKMFAFDGRKYGPEIQRVLGVEFVSAKGENNKIIFLFVNTELSGWLYSGSIPGDWDIGSNWLDQMLKDVKGTLGDTKNTSRLD